MNEPRRYFFRFLNQKHYNKDNVPNNGTINTMLKMLSKFRKRK